jgi:hypothetical protein
MTYISSLPSRFDTKAIWPVPAGLRVGGSVGGKTVGVDVGGSGVLVGGTGVSVSGTGVSVGGAGGLVGSTGVSVNGTGVSAGVGVVTGYHIVVKDNVVVSCATNGDAGPHQLKS